MSVEKIVLFFSLAVSSALAYEAPSRYLNQPQGFMASGLGRSCFALDVAADSIPCNPAFVAKEKARRFNSNLFWGNSISYLKEATDLSQGTANETTIQNLFTRHEDNELQSQIELGYWHETFSWSVTPARVNYNSTFRNQALPEISLYASLEESAQIQLGSYLSDDWSFGVQLRYVHRRFVASQFFLTDVLLPDGKKWIEPKQQHLVFLEPGLLYAPESTLNPEFSLLVSNAGNINESYPEIPVVPQLHITTSITPKTNYGRYSLGVDITADKNIQKSSGPVSLGGFLEFGILRLFGHLARQENGIGFGIYNTWWNLGVTYRKEIFDNSLGESIETSKNYIILGIEL